MIENFGGNIFQDEALLKHEREKDLRYNVLILINHQNIKKKILYLMKIIIVIIILAIKLHIFP